MGKVEKEAVLTKKFNKFKNDKPAMMSKDFIEFADKNELNSDERDYIIRLIQKELKGAK